MGNKISVDLAPSSLDEINSFNTSNLPSESPNGKEDICQHLNLWSLSELQVDRKDSSTAINNANQFKSTPIDLSTINKSHFLLKSTDVYIVLLIFKKDQEYINEQSPFPTGLWGLIESSSNMTDRGLLYPLPENKENKQNLESFLLSKKDFVDNEFKYMLFIWNGKKSSGLLRSFALMKAFGLDKVLSESKIVPFLYYGYHIEKNAIVKGNTIKLKDITGDAVDNSEDSQPNSEKIFNYHETVYLFQWLYPIKENKKNKKIFFKGFNHNFLNPSSDSNYYNNFKTISKKMFHEKEIKDLGKNQTSNAPNKMLPPKLNLGFVLKKNEEQKQQEEAKNTSEREELNEQEEEDDYDYDDDVDIDFGLAPSNNIPANANLNQLKIPKITGLKVNFIRGSRTENEEEEDSLNKVPESILRETAEKIKQNEILDENHINALNENYLIKDEDRKRLISEYYSKHLSEIIPNFLYLSSYNAAKNKALLENNKITHIINCAADYCENLYEKDYKYLAFYLKDHAIENIECIFYECINYIEKALESKGRVLVHCIQGISRSVSVVIAYLIYKNKCPYNVAFSQVQSKRTIASPNLGFAIQLQNFSLRILEPPEKYRFVPKIFAVGLFQLEQAGKIVCRLMNEAFFENKEFGHPRLFDKRGVFLVVGVKSIYIWVGKKISKKKKDAFLDYANTYIKLLKQFENAPKSCTPVIINEEEETEAFLNDLFNGAKEKIEKYKKCLSSEFTDWNNWYKETQRKKDDKKLSENNSNATLNKDEVKKAFYLYPSMQPEAMMDFDDLNDNQFLITCVMRGKAPIVYRWKGGSIEISEEKCAEYKDKVINEFFKTQGVNEEEISKIKIIDETPVEESDEFLELLFI